MQKDVVRQGRLGGTRTVDIESFLSSMEADHQIAEPDLLVDMAHLLMLLHQGVVEPAPAGEILKILLRMVQNGIPESSYDTSYEDIHAGIESGIIAELGIDIGGRLHIGRSRNDEVATCLRIRTRELVLEQLSALVRLRKVLLDRAEKHVETVMPGFTHLQHAQPTTLAHYLLAYEEIFSRDSDRLYDAYRRVNCSPLGAAAFASTGYPIDREMTMRLLGFDELVLNSMDAVASRDFAGEVLAADTLLLTSVSRICEELVLWSSSFVRFVELDDAFCSTSSIMPQKKNSDVAEILRSRAGSVLGELVSAMTIMKGLPMAYNRDMQDLNPHLWRGCSMIRRDIDLLAGMIATAEFHEDRMAEEAAGGFSTATELADTLVREHGLSFRLAHNIVGKAVRSGRIDLASLTSAAEELTGTGIKDLTDEEIAKALAVPRSIAVRNHPGGPGPDAVRAALNIRRNELKKGDDLVHMIEKRITNAKEELVRKATEAAGL